MPSRLNSNEKEKQKQYFIDTLDAGWVNNEPLGKFVTEMAMAELSAAERQEIIMASDYAQDPLVRDSITLFGSRE